MAWADEIAAAATWVASNAEAAQAKARAVLEQLVDGRGKLIAMRPLLDRLPEAERAPALATWTRLVGVYNDWASLIGGEKIEVGIAPLVAALVVVLVAAAAYVTSWWGEVRTLQARAQIAQSGREPWSPAEGGVGSLVGPALGVAVLGLGVYAAVNLFGGKR